MTRKPTTRHANRLRLWKRACSVLLPWMLALASGPCAAQALPAPGQPGTYQHTQWTAEHGAPADIDSMAQTPDGWLWLGTSHGLMRFDGMRFTRAPGALGRARIHSLFAAPTGDLYASVYGTGVSVLHPDGRVGALPGADGTVVGTFGSMAMDRAGVLWGIGKAIYRHDGSRWVAVDRDPAWETTRIRSMLVDAAGTLWAMHDGGAKRFERARGRFEPVDRHPGSLAQAPDGSVFSVAKEGRSVTRLSGPLGPGARPARVNGAESRFAGLFDGGGTLWKLRCPEPVCLAHAAPGGMPVFDAPAGGATPLSGSDARQILEDQEGNVWIATGRGLDRFRASRLAHTSLAPGANMGLATDAEGSVWGLDADGALWELRPGQAPRREPAPPATLLVRDHGGGILLAGPRSIVRLAHGRRSETLLPPGPDGRPRDRRPFVLLDDGTTLWVAAADTGLIGWSGGRWHGRDEFHLPDRTYLPVPGAAGQVWAARANGDLLMFEDFKPTRYDARELGFMTGIFPGAEVVAGGDGGLGVLLGGRIRMLHADNEDVLRSVSGLVVTPDGDRWLNGAAGLVHVRAEDWRRALAQPQALLRYELFGPADGYPGRALIENAAPTLASGDGRVLWAIGTEGIAAFDTDALYRNPVRPVPHIDAVLTPGGALAAAGPVRIAPGTERFGIQFTAPLLRMPERARFEYRLDGFDDGWQEGGARRTAEYTHVPPGTYAFRVRAFNEDGVPGTGEAVLALQVAPAMPQTLWFRGLCVLLAVVLAAGLVRYRVHAATRRMAERLRVKTDERERIARTLHDSFLQSLQGLLMRLDAVAARLPADTTPRRELEAIRDHANDALVEGRGQLAELRVGDPASLDDVIVRCLDELRATVGNVRFTLQTEGERRPLHAAIAQEIAAIAREALRNAAAHARAGRIRVTLAYGRRGLTLSVADDGQGLPAEVVRTGARTGHWGLVGMRERAERIGGLLAVDSQAGQGTTVRLAVPAKRTYLDA